MDKLEKEWFNLVSQLFRPRQNPLPSDVSGLMGSLDQTDTTASFPSACRGFKVFDL